MGLVRSEAGQSTVELVALLPLIAAVAVGGFTLLAARSAGEQSAAAAQAGAMALIQEADPHDAARASLPRASRSSASVRVDGREVHVTVRPKGLLGALAGSLDTSAVATAGLVAPAP